MPASPPRMLLPWSTAMPLPCPKGVWNTTLYKPSFMLSPLRRGATRQNRSGARRGAPLTNSRQSADGGLPELELGRGPGRRGDARDGDLIRPRGEDAEVDPPGLEPGQMRLEVVDVGDPEGRVETQLVAFGGGEVPDIVDGIADPVDEQIGAGAAVDVVEPAAGRHRVIARITEDAVVPGAAVHVVRAGAAVHDVVVGIA